MERIRDDQKKTRSKTKGEQRKGDKSRKTTRRAEKHDKRERERER